jgi:hypothetical protein
MVDNKLSEVKKMPKLRVTLGIGFHGAKHESILTISEEEWEACVTDYYREELIQEYWQEWANNYIDGVTEIIEEDES